MKNRLTTSILALLLPSTALAFTATGRFTYDDRMWNKDGYTGATQQLPIRHAKVELVNLVTQEVLASGATDATGAYSLQATAALVPLNLYVRCSTDGRSAGYEIRVVDEIQRGVSEEPTYIGSIHAAMTAPVLAHNTAQNLDFGTYSPQDTDGTGVAQAFHIFDNAVDFFDWMAQPALLGRLPAASEYVVYGWSPTSASEASNYSRHAILIASPGQGNDTDGWSDTVILHETGHWFDDFFSNSDNPGGAHTLGDNNQDPRLSYGEGVATFHCSKVRDWRSRTRLNGLGQPMDAHVSLYGDLAIPPDPPAAGALSFAYDFETGIAFQPGLPPTGLDLGQRGTANETNITSAQWDLVDAADSADETPGIDDDAIAVGHDRTWAVERVYLPGMAASNPVTVEDYYQGWYASHGADFMRPQVDEVFIVKARMEFELDDHEPDGQLASAGTVVPVAHNVSSTGHVVISEIEVGAQDAIELYNATPNAIALTGWRMQVYVNGDEAPVVTRIYTFPAFTLGAGEVVTVYERGDPLNNGRYHLYAGTTPNAFNASWNHGLDGAVVLRDVSDNAVDFVRWRAADGTENSTPVPAGVTFGGALDAPSAPPFVLARDVSGTDNDLSTDFTAQMPSLASANHPSPQHHTLFATGDEDLFEFEAVGGTRYGFEARGSFSASDPLIEVLSSTGALLGSNDDSDIGVNDARVDFYANEAATYYVRVRNAGIYTDWAAYDLVAFARPVASSAAGPSGMTAAAENFTDIQDRVVVRWLNAGAYDAVRVYRDGTELVTLPGAPAEYEDHADVGVHTYEVAGIVGGAETSRVHTYEYAGSVRCFSSDDFESGNALQWDRDGTTWDVTPMAQSGTWGFTDSPNGLYESCPADLDGCTIHRSATFLVPTRLPSGSLLTFDQICITEHCEGTPCDICVVEISTDDGLNWTELARYDQASDPAWADNVADPTDWRPASIPLDAYAGRTAKIRFRLQSDPLLALDGWYVDNVRINTGDCPTDVEDVANIRAFEMLPASPNPMRKSARFAFAMPKKGNVEIAIHDVGGRVVRRQALGAQSAGRHFWVWDGQDGHGRSVAGGVYFATVRAGDASQTRKVVKLER